MDISKTISALKHNNYSVKYFRTCCEAASYLDSVIDNATVGFGDSQTLKSMRLYEMLSSHNNVYDPNQSTDNESFLKIAKQSLDTEIFITSANAVSESGELVNIDGTGNRIAGSLFGHDKVYFVITTNKIECSLEKAIWRARNIAAPLNAAKYDLHTPCVRAGNICCDCSAPDRICNAITIYMKKMNDMEMEIILIDEPLGF